MVELLRFVAVVAIGISGSYQEESELNAMGMRVTNGPIQIQAR
jgi:hypothetical protein